MRSDEFRDPIKPDAAVRLSESELSRFGRNEDYYRASLTMLGTPGISFVAKTGDADWIVAIISSAQGSPELLAAGDFQVWDLAVDLAAKTGVLTASDREGHELLRHVVRYTRFPVAAMKFYCASGKYGFVLMLPSEY